MPVASGDRRKRTNEPRSPSVNRQRAHHLHLGEKMHDTIFVSRWGPATRSLTRLILPPSLERLAPDAGASSDVDAFYRSGPG